MGMSVVGTSCSRGAGRRFDDGWVDGNVNPSHKVERHSSSPDTIARAKSNKTKILFYLADRTNSI